jgi:streptogramin lyase
MKSRELQIGLIFILFLLAGFAAFAEPQQIITNFAGTGIKGFGGDGGAASEAQLNGPNGIVRGPDGALYICDTGNQRIRKVTRDGRITTVAGTGEAGWSGDGGPATKAKLNEPYEVRFDSAGNLYWVERLSATVRGRDAKTGVVTTVAGTGAPGFSGDGGQANKARLNEPHSIGFDKSGDLYICDVKNHRIRKVDMKTGKISTFSGTGGQGPALDGGAIKEAALSGPRALDFDKDGNLWVALREGNAVLKLDLAAGVVRRVAGTGIKGLSGDSGAARNAELSGPKGVSVAIDGDVFIADTENNAIRKIDVNKGTIHLVAGTGNHGDGSATDPLKCELARPHGIFVDRDGSVFIGDTEANRVRVVRRANF